MKIIKSFTIVIGFVISLSQQLSCTSNPLGDSEIATASRKISGEVKVNTNENPEDVFIWFEGFNLNTRPDKQGNFQFILPSPAAQSSNGGITGIFNLYFYIANFNLVIKPIILLDGVISNSKEEINENGEFTQEILLTENLKISTEIRPKIVEKDSGVISISATVILQTFKDTTDVFFPTRVGTLSAPVFLENSKTGEISIIQTKVLDKTVTDSLRVSTTAELRELEIELNLSEIPPGKYEVIPYLIVINPLVPQGLLDSIGTNVQNLGPNYLKIPFKRRDGQFEIVEKKIEERDK
ncbi:MAG: hypothetical protein ACE5HX_07290 [bacterium]